MSSTRNSKVFNVNRDIFTNNSASVPSMLYMLTAADGENQITEKEGTCNNYKLSTFVVHTDCCRLCSLVVITFMKLYGHC